MTVYKIRRTSGLFVPDKIYRTRGHAQSKITNIIKERVRMGLAIKEDLSKEYEIVEYELVETMSIPYDQLKKGR